MKKTVSVRKTTKFVPIVAPSATPNPFVQAMRVQSNLTTTENGALTNKSTLSAVLDLFGAAGAVRTRTPSDVIALFSKAFAEDRLAATKILFYIRDVRSGQGERKTFRTLLNWLGQHYPDVVRLNLENVAFYGRYDDLYALMGTPLEKDVFNLIGTQLKKDIKSMKNKESVSLLAKWLKSENTSSSESRALGARTRQALEITSKRYRKILSALRQHINVIEVDMCANNWSGINFERVPSKASSTYRKAFGKHDQERYAEYLKSVEKGEKKINAGAIFPYEILRSLVYRTPSDIDIKQSDLQWKAMPNWLEGNDHRGIVISDVSGSMSMSSGLPLLVSISLALYFAERNEGPFKDIWMNFSSTPTFQKFQGNNLYEKCRNMNRSNWGMSTNLEAAFDLILNTATKSKINQKDMPSALYIVSDMEFDATSSGVSNFDMIRAKYAAAGYKLPRVIWWNVNSRNDNFPIRSDANGTAMVSGCSPSILKSLLGAKSFDPMSIVFDTINNPRYDRVTV